MTQLKYWNGSSWETIVLGATGATGGTAYGDASQIVTGQLSVANGGTGSNNASGATTNLSALSYSNFADSRYGSSTAYEVIPRMNVQGSSQLGTNGAPSTNNARMSVFTPYRTLTVSSLTSFCTTGTTDTGGTPVRRMGLFVNPSGTNWQCIARTASDSTLWNTSSTVYLRTLEASFGNTDANGYVVLTAGVSYGFVCLAYNGTAANFVAPSVGAYSNALTGASTLMNLAPAMAYYSSYSDFTGGNQTFSTPSFAMPYGRLGVV